MTVVRTSTAWSGAPSVLAEVGGLSGREAAAHWKVNPSTAHRWLNVFAVATQDHRE